MIGNSPIDYLAIRSSIYALRAIAPASILYLVSCMWKPEWFYLPLAIVSAAEGGFYLFVYLPRRSRLQAPPRHSPPALSLAQRQATFQRCLEAEKSHMPTVVPYPRGWFIPNNIPPRREDVIDWLLWAFFGTSREEINLDEYQEELQGYIRTIESHQGKPLEPGRCAEAGLRSMRVTLDPVVMLHRPLLWYFIVALVDTYTSISLICLGFKHYTPREAQWRLTFPPRPILYLLSRYAPPGVVTPYWYRPHKSTTKHPLVFLHGIGIGLYPYIPFFRNILSTSDSDVGILLPEMMSICMHMTPRSVPPRGMMLSSLNVILESLREEENNKPTNTDDNTPLLRDADRSNTSWDQVVLAAHSYGTFVAGWIVRECVMAESGLIDSRLASKIAHLVLVDPIPILLSNPAVAHNFLYREPSTVPPGYTDFVSVDHTDRHHLLATSPPPLPLTHSPKPTWYSSPAAWQLWFFASRDADIARTLFRAFFWAEGGVWGEDIDEWVNAGPAESSERHGKNIAVVLGGKDQIVPSNAIRRYLTGDVETIEHWVGRGTPRQADLFQEDQVEESEIRNILKGRNNSSRGVSTPVGADSSSSTGQETVSRGNGGRGKLEVLFNPVLDHAVIFDDPKWTKPLIEVVQRYIRDI